MRLAGDEDLLAGAKLERSLDVCGVHKNVALIEKHLNARAAYSLELCGDEVVEALACRFQGNGDGAWFSHVSPRLGCFPGLRRMGWRYARASAQAAPARQRPREQYRRLAGL